jgi:predicted RNA polymerase sigma factor
MKEDTKEKWADILQLYNLLLQIKLFAGVCPKPYLCFIQSKRKKEALIEAEKLELTSNHFYFALLGELYRNIDSEKAKFNFQKACDLAKNDDREKGHP